MPTVLDLGAKVKAKYPGKYGDLTDQQVGQRVKLAHPGAYDDFVDTVTVREHTRGKARRPEASLRARENPIVQHLPDIGGALGGFAGGGAGPVSAAGGAVGGATGEAIRQLINDAQGLATGNLSGPQIPESPLDAAQRIGTAAGTQAAYNFAGQGLAKGAQFLGKPLMGAALRFTPEVAQTAIREGITATRAGVQKIMTRLGELGDRTTAMLRQSTARGNRFDPVVFLNGAEKSLADEVTGNRTPEVFHDVEMFRDLSSNFLRRNQGPLTPLELQNIKTAADAIATPLWKKIAQKEPITALDKAKAKWYKAVADHARDLLEQTTPEMIDPVTRQPITLAEQNARTKALIELKKVIAPEKMSALAQLVRPAISPLGRATGGAAAGAALPGDKAHHAAEGAALGVLTTPQALSWLALRAQSPILAHLLRQAPRAVGVAVQ